MHRLDQLFPMDPITLVAALRRLEAKILLYAPELTTADCDRLLGELAITDGLLSRRTAKIRASPEWQRRMALPEVDASLQQLGLLPPAPVKRQRWRAVVPRVKYPKPSSPAVHRAAVSAAETNGDRQHGPTDLTPSEARSERAGVRPRGVPGD